VLVLIADTIIGEARSLRLKIMHPKRLALRFLNVENWNDIT
jgi:hypothetical protein